MVKLFGTCNKEDGINSSPFVWKTYMALKHKGIQFDFKTLPVRQVHIEISKLTEGKHKLVPTLVDDDNTVVYESYKIAEYLEKKYPNNPKLFPNGNALAKFLEDYFATTPLFLWLMLDIYNSFDPENQAYFRETREKAFGCTLEQFAGKKEDHTEKINQFLYPLRSTLAKSSYFEGDEVTYSDYIVYGMFKTTQMISKSVFDEIITDHKDQSLKVWFDKVDKLNVSNGFK